MTEEHARTERSMISTTTFQVSSLAEEGSVSLGEGKVPSFSDSKELEGLVEGQVKDSDSFVTAIPRKRKAKETWLTCKLGPTCVSH